ncbi:hypothetical protein GCK72_010907 [Caenorhabditis remanei]|uniref:Tyrosine-protein phosphatase domain-containing protein n=1 Tax=Caenorhabditis remanei TaxID=31234 RepID=A0A6A5H6C5_CAERE|nr:hypothetical protein GCK72_010907 [Caenorhabditis remanei]KAF1762645.1 hypothetical protein GCK72_010907 [Caenorhabditis remanei]
MGAKIKSKNSRKKRSKNLAQTKNKSKSIMKILTILILIVTTSNTVSGNDSPNLHLQKRGPRASQGNFQPILENMERLARISNGVSLEIGLHDESIPADEVISELLHMGSLKPDDIISMDSSAVNGAITGIEDVNKQLESDVDVIATETRLINFEKVRLRSKFMLNLTEFSEKEEYKAELINVTAINWTISEDISTISDAASALQLYFKNIDKWSNGMSEDTANDAVVELPTISVKLKQVENSMQTLFNDIIPLVAAAKQLKPRTIFLDILNEEKTIRAQLEGKTIYQSYKESVMKNLKKIQTSRGSLENVKTVFESLQQLAQNRFKKQSFEYTSGFSKGSVDLDKLGADISNDWIVKRIDESSIVTTSLNKAFSFFEDIKDALVNVEKSWKPLADVSKRKSVQMLVDALLSVISESEDLGKVEAVVDQLASCGNSLVQDTPDSSKLDIVSGKIRTFNDVVGKLSDFEYAKVLGDLSAFKNVRVGVPTKTDAENFVNQLKKLSAFGSTWNALKKLKTDLNDLSETTKEIPGKLAEISSEFVNIDNYHTDISKSNYIQFFTCLHNTEGGLVKKSVETLQKVRFAKDEIDNASPVITAIIGSKSNMEAALTSAGNMKEVMDREVTTLKESFPDAQSASKNLGNGVRGLAAINSIHNSWPDLEALFKDISGIVEAGKSVGLSQQHQTAFQKLALLRASMTETHKGIEDFLNTVATIQNLRKKRNTKITDIKTSASVMEAASKIKQLPHGISDDVSSIKEALDSLNVATSSKYAKEVEVMGLLDGLNLDFSGFQPAATSLGHLDTFFATYGATMASASVTIPSPAPTPAPSQPPNQSPVVTTIASMMIQIVTSTVIPTTEAISIGTIAMYIGLSLVVIGGLGGFGALVYCCCIKKAPPPDDDEEERKRKQKEEADKKDKEEKEKLRKQEEEQKKKINNDQEQNNENARGNNDVAPGASSDALATAREIVATPAPSNDRLPSEVDAREPSKKDEKVEPEVVAPEVVAPEVVKTEVVRPQRTIIEENIYSMLISMVFQFEKSLSTYMSFDAALKTELEDLRLQCAKNITRDDICAPKETRSSTYFVHGKTALKVQGFETDFINGNAMKIGKKTYMMFQAPSDGSESVSSSDPKDSTIAKHLAFILQRKVRISLMLCVFKYRSCAEYFSETVGERFRFKNLTVTTDKITKDVPGFTDNENYTLYTITIRGVGADGAPIEHTTDILQFSGWSNNWAPSTLKHGVEMIQFVERYKGPILVHCSNGTGRSGTLVAIKYGMWMVKTKRFRGIFDLICDVRACRYGAVSTPTQVLYVLLSVGLYMITEMGLKTIPSFDKIQYIYANLHNYSVFDTIGKWKKKAYNKAILDNLVKEFNDELVKAKEQALEKEKEVGDDGTVFEWKLMEEKRLEEEEEKEKEEEEEAKRKKPKRSASKTTVTEGAMEKTSDERPSAEAAMALVPEAKEKSKKLKKSLKSKKQSKKGSKKGPKNSVKSKKTKESKKAKKAA